MVGPGAEGEGKGLGVKRENGPQLGGEADAVRAIGDAIEAQGYRHLVAYDHVLGAEQADRQPELTGPYDENDPFHDPFVLFAYLAGL